MLSDGTQTFLAEFTPSGIKATAMAGVRTAVVAGAAAFVSTPRARLATSLR